MPQPWVSAGLGRLLAGHRERLSTALMGIRGISARRGLHSPAPLHAHPAGDPSWVLLWGQERFPVKARLGQLLALCST